MFGQILTTMEGSSVIHVWMFVKPTDAFVILSLLIADHYDAD